MKQQPIIPQSPAIQTPKQFIIPAEYQNVSNQQKIILNTFGTQLAKTGAFTITTGELFDNNTQVDDYYNLIETSAAFGLPIFDVLYFKGKSWTDNQGNQYQIGDGLSQYMVSTCLIEVNQVRNIVRTPIQGRDGTVKEYVSDGDFEITIKGMLASNKQNVFPQKDVLISTGTYEMGMTTLQQFRFCKDSITVSSNILNYFGVTNLVITDMKYTQQEGDRSVVPFEIKALSDKDYQIKLKYN